MSHELYATNGSIPMAYVGETPWHGLGQKLEPGQPLDVWAEQAGMDFEIQEADATYEAVTNEAGGLQNIRFPGKKVLYRDLDGEPYGLGIVGERYRVIQPKQVLGFFEGKTKEMGFTLETAGVLYRGTHYWALARTPETLRMDDDQLTAYLMMITSCDGSMSTQAYFTAVRAVCKNTIDMGQEKGQMGARIRLSHRSIYDVTAEEKMKTQLGLHVAWEKFSTDVKKLADTKMTEDQAFQFFLRTLGKDPSKEDDITPAAKKTAELLLTKFSGQGMGASMTSAKGTAWGAVNAVTEYVDWDAGRKGDQFEADRRIYSAQFEGGRTLKNTAFTLAMGLV